MIIASVSSENSPLHPTLRDALVKIRFLTLTPQQFAEGPASSSLLSQSEKFAILMNISSPATDIPMPEGFSTSTVSRREQPNKCSTTPQRVNLMLPNGRPNPIHPSLSVDQGRKMYCTRDLLQHTSIFNQSVLDCSVTVTVDKNICIYGIQVMKLVLLLRFVVNIDYN